MLAAAPSSYPSDVSNGCTVPVAWVESAPVWVRWAVSAVPAGFPSPAQDYDTDPVDLVRALVPNPAATFVCRVSGHSMVGAGIHDGDELLVDRSLPVVDGRIVVAVLADGEFTVKRFRRTGSGVVLESEHPDYPPIAIRDSESRIWGVVRTVIHHV